MKKNSKQNGFSLIEIILYLGILSIVLLVLMSFFGEEVYLKGKISDKIEITYNAQFALDKISWYLHQTEIVNSPTSGQTQNNLSLNLNGTNQNPLEIFVENETLKVRQGNNEALALTNERVKVKNLTFTNYGFVNKEPIVQIGLEVVSASNFWHNPPINLQTSVKIGK